MATFTTSIEIAAPPAVVFDFLVTNDGLTAWMGEAAALDPHAGGIFAVDIAGYAVRGTFLEIDPPRRVSMTWGMVGNPALLPGSSTVEFTLVPTASGTRVDLVHSDLPESEVAGHTDGWAHFTARFRIASSGGDPGRDRWRPRPDRLSPTQGVHQ